MPSRIRRRERNMFPGFPGSMGIEHGGLHQTLPGSAKWETQRGGSLAFPDLACEDRGLCAGETAPLGHCQLELMRCILDQTARTLLLFFLRG